MDGILSEETFKRLQKQAQADRQASDLSSLQKETIPGLERDAKLLSKYVELAKTGVRNRYRGDTSTVPAEERLWYAEQAEMLQPSIEKRVQAAGLIPSVQEQPVAQQVQASSQQPQPTAPPEAPAQLSANTPAPEKPKYDPFEQFRRVDEMRRGFFGAAVSKLNELPQQYRAKALRAAKDYWEMTGPKLPPNALLPVQNPLTGDMIQGMAMTPEGKIVEIPGASQELPKELSPIATKRAEAISYADQSLAQLDNLLGKLKDTKISDSDKIIAGKDFLPAYTRIQSQGPNVLGVDEAKRTGQALETEYGDLLNIFNEKQVIGTDLPRFIKQLEFTKSTIQSARKQELETLRRLSPKTASYFDTVDTRVGQQQSAPGGVLIYNQGTKSFAPAR